MASVSEISGITQHLLDGISVVTTCLRNKFKILIIYTRLANPYSLYGTIKQQGKFRHVQRFVLKLKDLLVIKQDCI